MHKILAVLLISCSLIYSFAKTPGNPEELLADPSGEKATSYTLDATTTIGDSIVRTAMEHIGARYRSGNKGPNAFDCSGFTSYVYSQQKIDIAHSSRTQYTEGEPVAISDLKKGDLVFFGNNSSRSRINHVGIVTNVEDGSFEFIHACNRGVTVDTYPDVAYYAKRFVGARRIITE